MPVPAKAIQKEAERFRRLTAAFRARVEAGETSVGDSAAERERLYEILVSVNNLIEERLAKT